MSAGPICCTTNKDDECWSDMLSVEMMSADEMLVMIVRPDGVGGIHDLLCEIDDAC